MNPNIPNMHIMLSGGEVDTQAMIKKSGHSATSGASATSEYINVIVDSDMS